MKRVKNNSLQRFSVLFQTEEGMKRYPMRPGETKIVPDSYITKRIRTLSRRRLFKITNA